MMPDVSNKVHASGGLKQNRKPEKKKEARAREVDLGSEPLAEARGTQGLLVLRRRGHLAVTHPAAISSPHRPIAPP